ncbi:hypothetical protein [Streptomyces sp. IGB124]|uniref:hypothetical protein n=1 Tax=Streptomyces sp. IGB124 TaxID=1519485 RepID=UPI0006AF4E6A|nr:hypothetical protein [Streptomyces sp. IGB124]KOU62433.1 hypothetical protein ADK96_26505 [Streptomyces sp. IGB124]
MTDLVIHIPADWLTQVFLTLRRGVTEDAHALATELQPFTEKPGQRVPVPSTTLLRAEQALLRAPVYARQADGADGLSQDIGHHGHSSEEHSRYPPGRPAPASGRRGAPGRSEPVQRWAPRWWP